MPSEQEYLISGNERRGPVVLPDWNPDGEQSACPLCGARGHVGHLYPLVDGRQMCSCCWSIFVPVKRHQAEPHDGEEGCDGK